MKKFTALFPLLFISSTQAGTFGTEIQSGMIQEIYQDCIGNGKLGKLAEIMEVPKSQWCGCLIGQMQSQFDSLQLDQRLNDGNITIKQFEQDMEKVGEKSVNYCVDKLVK